MKNRARTSSRWLLLLSLLACAWATVARGQQVTTSVSINITNLSIQSEVNAVDSNFSFKIVGAPAYVYSITGNVHGEGPVFSTLVPTSEPASTAFEAISPGLSSVLQGSVSNPGSTLPSSILSEQVSSGTNGMLNATFSLSIDASGEVTFSVTNVAITNNGQPDASDRLVFDSGVVDVTALFPDVSVGTRIATNITTQGATLQSTVTCPNNSEAYFIYATNPEFTGTNPALNGTSAMVSLGASGTSQNVAIPVTGLRPHQLYYFKAVGQDVTGPSFGGLETFTTLDNPLTAGTVPAFAGVTPMMIPVLASSGSSAGDKLKIIGVSGGIGGVAALTSGGRAVTYQFTSATQPQDHFQYTIIDGFGGSATGQVNVVNYATLAATYCAVLLDPLAQNAAGGLLRVTLAATGRFTGSLVIGQSTYPISGALDWSGQFSKTLKTGLPGGATVTLNLVQQGGGYVLNASVATNFQSLAATLTPAAAGVSGYYTMLIPPPPGATYVGSGYATVQITSNGLVTIAGALPDGAAFTCPSAMDAAGQAGVFALLYSPLNRGSLAGALTVSGSTGAQISGSMVWIKPNFSSAPFNQGPFTMVLTGSGGRYIPPVKAAALQFGTLGNIGQLTISGGNLFSTIQHGLGVAANNQVTIFGQPNQFLTLAIQPATGLFSGQFLDPVLGVRRTLHGALLQGSATGGGYFLGASVPGEIDIAP